MFNFLLNTNLESFKRFFSMPQIWIAMFLCVVGVALVVLARRITRVAKNTDKVEDNDQTLVAIKCVGIIMLIIAVLIIVFTE